jgi:hypothetical protein
LQLCEDKLPVTNTPEDTKVPEKPVCSKDGNHICFDCNTAPICVRTPNGYQYIDKVNCAEQDANAPFCTKGVCSANPTDKCKTDPPKPNLICTSNGYFPDPNDCQKFYFCVKDTPTVYSCSNNFVYSHKQNSCIRRSVSSDCAVIKCKYTTLIEYVIYPKDPNVYGVCLRNRTTMMYKCPEEEQFDTKTSECIFVCNQVGLFALPGDERKYRECISVGSNKFELKERECPVGSIFNAKQSRCVIWVKWMYWGVGVQIRNSYACWEPNYYIQIFQIFNPIHTL